MRVLVVGEFDSDNVGDKFIGEGHRRLFSPLVDELVVLPLGGRKAASSEARENGEGGHRRSAVRMLHRSMYASSFSYRHLVEATRNILSAATGQSDADSLIANFDAVVIGGGQLLSDGTLRMLYGLDRITRAANRHGVPVAAFGTGASYPRTWISRRLLSMVVRRLSAPCWFRDRGSVEVVRELCGSVREDFRVTPDCAIAAAATEQTAIGNKDVIGVAPMPPGVLARAGHEFPHADQWWVRLVECIYRHGKKPVLFSTGAEVDAHYVDKVAGMVRDRGVDVVVLARPRSCGDLVGQLCMMGGVIAQRMHASVVYYAIGGSPFGVSWDAKVGAFFEEIGLPDRLVSLSESRPDDVVRMLLKDGRPKAAVADVVAKSMRDARECVERLVKLKGR
jgi:polysaccharide pyruvyl transferase WcaK-like protein